MTANQVVAHNLRHARKEKGWTQEQAAQELWPYTGRKWSKASWSDAERSARNGRDRVFDANELLAFARVFGRPLAWFFTPPDDVDRVWAGTPEGSKRADEAWRVVSRAELLEAIGPDPDHETKATLRQLLERLERRSTVTTSSRPRAPRASRTPGFRKEDDDV
jgi:transcriptional regulator with XRE-family HTH domain